MEAQAAALPHDDALGLVPPADVPVSEGVTAGESVQGLRLVAGELLLAGPVAAVFTRVAGDGSAAPPIAGLLYVTNRSLVQAGRVERTIDLRRITELGLAAGKVLVTIARSRGLMVEVENAQALRSVIADAVSARRAGRRSELVPVMARGLGAVADAELVEDAADVTADRTG
jgi:hypothetical protein